MSSIFNRIGILMPSRYQVSAVRRGKPFSRIDRRPFRVYWLVMGLFGLLIITVEIIDHNSMHVAHGSSQSLFEDAELIREILMYGIMLPVFGGILLTLLTRTGSERDLAVKELDHQRAFAEEIHEISDWNELADRIARFPGTILPAVRTLLTVFDIDNHRPGLAAQWAAGGEYLPDLSSELAHLQCQNCLSSNGSTACHVQPCNVNGGFLLQEDDTRFCLPITSADKLVAVLNFDLTNEQRLTDHQRRMLTDVEPQMALALENAQLQRSKSTLIEVAAGERQRIARDLHDTLAQNITYLRLKLEQLGSEGSLQEIAAIRHEIGRMREVADEAYLQVRQTLIALRTENQTDITKAIKELVDSTQRRANLEVQLESHGRPLPLPPQTLRQAVYICREALNNVEKHAEAQTVRIELLWGPHALAITIRDDGRGFDSTKTRDEHCFGMTIMDERAAIIDGQLSVHSTPNQGTTILLTFPVVESDRSGVVPESLSLRES